MKSEHQFTVQKGSSETSERLSPLWRSFLSSVQSMLQRVDPIASMDPMEVAGLTPASIQKLGAKVGRLPLSGVREWEMPQVSALTMDQLLALGPGHVQIIAERVGAAKHREWLLEAFKRGSFLTLPHLLSNIQDPSAIQDLAEAMAENPGHHAASCLFYVAQYGLDWQLTSLLENFPEETFRKIVLSDVDQPSLPEPSVSGPIILEEQQRLIDKQNETHAQLERIQEMIHELDSYEHTLIHVQHPAIREKVFRDFREWLASTIFAQAGDGLPETRELLNLSPLQQKVLLRQELHNIKTEMQARLDCIQAEADILWASFDELAKEWEAVCQQHQEQVELSTRVLSKLEDLEKDLEPYTDALRDSKQRGPSIEEIDSYMQEIRRGIQEAEELSAELDKLEQRLEQIRQGLDHDVTKQFLKDNGPSRPDEIRLFGLQVFKRMAKLASKPEEDPRVGNLKQRIQMICDRKLCEILEGRSELYKNIHSTLKQVQELQLQLAEESGSAGASILARCKQRLHAWQCLREQIQRLVE